MFVSAYLEAARVLGRDDCRAFALKTLERILAEAWDEAKGFRHRVGGPRLEGSLDDQIFAAAALLDAYEATLDRRYFDIAERAVRLGSGTLRRSRWRRIFRSRERCRADGRPGRATQAAAGFADAGCEFRRGDRARSPVRIHRRKALSRVGGKDAGSFRRARAAVWIIRRDVRPCGAAARAASFASGGAGRGQEIRKPPRSKKPRTKFIVSAKRCCASRRKRSLQPRSRPALRETLPHLDAAKPQALVCVETTCHPPVTDPAKLQALLGEVATTTAAL